MRFIFVIIIAVAAAVPACAFDGMTPQLAARLQTLGSGELVRVNVIMKERYDAEVMASMTRGLSRAERRAVVVNELRRFARDTQGDVLNMLAEAERAGRSRRAFTFAV